MHSFSKYVCVLGAVLVMQRWQQIPGEALTVQSLPYTSMPHSWLDYGGAQDLNTVERKKKEERMSWASLIIMERVRQLFYEIKLQIMKKKATKDNEWIKFMSKWILLGNNNQNTTSNQIQDVIACMMHFYFMDCYERKHAAD